MDASSNVRWVEVRCGHIRGGSQRPCNRLLVSVAVSPDSPGRILRYHGTGMALSGSRNWKSVPLPPAAAGRPRAHAISTSGSFGGGSRGTETRVWTCHPKRCGNTVERREDKLADQALEAVASGLSRIYIF